MGMSSTKEKENIPNNRAKRQTEGNIGVLEDIESTTSSDEVGDSKDEINLKGSNKKQKTAKDGDSDPNETEEDFGSDDEVIGGYEEEGNSDDEEVDLDDYEENDELES